MHLTALNESKNEQQQQQQQAARNKCRRGHEYRKRKNPAPERHARGARAPKRQSHIPSAHAYTYVRPGENGKLHFRARHSELNSLSKKIGKKAGQCEKRRNIAALAQVDRYREGKKRDSVREREGGEEGI